jgi:hypothetical protein
MSHFTVLVKISKENLKKAAEFTGSDDQDVIFNHAIGASLSPFQENNMGDCPENYMESEDTEDEHLEEWKTGSVDMIRHRSTGELIFSFEKEKKIGF